MSIHTLTLKTARWFYTLEIPAKFLPRMEKTKATFGPVYPLDGKHIVYTVAAYGTFVCDINGENPVSLKKLNAPTWLNNEWVIGMNDKDDGDQVITSEIIAVTINGKIRQTLTTPFAKIAMYPAASADGKQIAFNSEKGQIYIMNIELK